MIRSGGSVRESLLVAILSSIGFVAWGLWVNWDYGMASRVQVALTQGGISFVATFGSAELLRWLAGLLSGVKARGLVTGVVGWFLINGIVFVAHWVFGTPEILRTMLPGMLTGLGFCYFYGKRVSAEAKAS